MKMSLWPSPALAVTAAASGCASAPRRRRDDARPGGPPRTADAAPALCVEGLRAAYGLAPVLDDVSLRVEPGEIVALIGPNGAGKTTLLRALSGLIPSAGRVTLHGQALQGRAPQAIVAAGLVHCPEGRQLFVDLSVEDNLRLGAYLRRDFAAVAADLVRFSRLFPVLSARRHQRAGTLSGGEQQMLAVARSLMARPDVLLLDEPSFGIAPRMVEHIFSVLRTLCAGGLTALVVEQNTRVALELAHRAYVLEGGRIVLEGSSADLLCHAGVREAYLGL